MPLTPLLANHHVARTTDSGNRSPLAFFALIFVLSVPFWLVGAATGRQLTADLPISSFIATGTLAQIGPFLDFGPGGYPLEAQRIAALLLIAVAVVVTVLWRPGSLPRPVTI